MLIYSCEPRRRLPSGLAHGLNPPGTALCRRIFKNCGGRCKLRPVWRCADELFSPLEIHCWPVSFADRLSGGARSIRPIPIAIAASADWRLRLLEPDPESALRLSADS